MNHYPRHIGDFVKDTLGFGQGAIGAYDLLLDAYYANEQAPAAEDVYVIGRATTAAERRNVDRALTKFQLRDGRYFHKRVEEELAAYRGRAESARENGKKGGRKPNTEPTDNPRGTEERTEQVTHEEPKPNRSGKLASNQEPKPEASAVDVVTSPRPRASEAGSQEKGNRISGIVVMCSQAKVDASVGEISKIAERWTLVEHATDTQIARAITEGRVQKRDGIFSLGFIDSILKRQMAEDAKIREAAQRKVDATQALLAEQREAEAHASAPPEGLMGRWVKPKRPEEPGEEVAA